jgi:hypothetical protein
VSPAGEGPQVHRIHSPVPNGQLQTLSPTTAVTPSVAPSGGGTSTGALAGDDVTIRVLAVPCYSGLELNAAATRTGGGNQLAILIQVLLEHGDITALWDTGAEADFIAWHTIQKYGLQSRVRTSDQKVKYGDGSIRPARGTITITIELECRQGSDRCRRSYELNAVVADLQPRFDLVLGMPFCQRMAPQPDWEAMTISLPTEAGDGWLTCLRAPATVVEAKSQPNLNRMTEARKAGGRRVMDPRRRPEETTVRRLNAAEKNDFRGSWFPREISPRELRHLLKAGELRADSVSLGLLRAAPEGPSGATDALTPEEVEREKRRKAVISSFPDVFTDKLPPIDPSAAPKPGEVVHTIELKPGSTPYTRSLRRLSTLEQDELNRQLHEYIESGRIVPSESPWGTNVIFARKKDGGLRFCVDYRGLNDKTIRNSYALPHMEELFDRLQGARYFSKIDLRTGFYQILLAHEDRAKTAFRTRYGHFEWTVLPMGLTNAPATFQHLMNSTFQSLLYQCVLVFLDDIVIFSHSLEQHEKDVREVLQRLQKKGLVAKLSKCELFQHEIEFLGHRVGRDGLRVMASKVEAVESFPVPEGVGELRSFLGLAGYYRRFVEGFSKIAAPLHELTKDAGGGPFGWQPAHQEAFDELKRRLREAPVLALPDPNRAFVVNTHASDFATGAVLQQDFGSGLQPIAYLSHKMVPAQTRYPTHDKEMLAIVNMLAEWRPHLQGRQPFTIRIRTDHNSLQYFMTKSVLTARQARWLDQLAEFDFTIEYVKGPTNFVADALSRRADHRVEAALNTLAAAEGTGDLVLATISREELGRAGASTPQQLLASARAASARMREDSSPQQAAGVNNSVLGRGPADDRRGPPHLRTVKEVRSAHTRGHSVQSTLSAWALLPLPFQGATGTDDQGIRHSRVQPPLDRRGEYERIRARPTRGGISRRLCQAHDRQQRSPGSRPATDE